MNYIGGRYGLQASVECLEDYVETDREVRVIDKIIDTLDIGFSKDSVNALIMWKTIKTILIDGGDIINVVESRCSLKAC